MDKLVHEIMAFVEIARNELESSGTREDAVSDAHALGSSLRNGWAIFNRDLKGAKITWEKAIEIGVRHMDKATYDEYATKAIAKGRVSGATRMKDQDANAEGNQSDETGQNEESEEDSTATSVSSDKPDDDGFDEEKSKFSKQPSPMVLYEAMLKTQDAIYDTHKETARKMQVMEETQLKTQNILKRANEMHSQEVDSLHAIVTQNQSVKEVMDMIASQNGQILAQLSRDADAREASQKDIRDLVSLLNAKLDAIDARSREDGIKVLLSETTPEERAKVPAMAKDANMHPPSMNTRSKTASSAGSPMRKAVVKEATAVAPKANILTADDDGHITTHRSSIEIDLVTPVKRKASTEKGNETGTAKSSKKPRVFFQQNIKGLAEKEKTTWEGKSKKNTDAKLPIYMTAGEEIIRKLRFRLDR